MNNRIIVLPFLCACGGSFGLDIAGVTDEKTIVNGTREPQNTFLTPGEVTALGFLSDSDGDPFCSGTLVRPRVVVTAQHCVRGRNSANTFYGFGVHPSSRDLLAPVAEIHTHPSIDFAMLILGIDPTETMTPLSPIDINRDPLGIHWQNRWVDAAGYGETYSSATGRFFASVQVVAWDDEIVNVYGHEQQGICWGDSGGPVIWQSDAGTPPVVVGTEQWGDDSCVGNDYLTRLDVVAPFFDDVLSEPLPAPLEECTVTTPLGECRDGDAVWCTNGYIHTEDCDTDGLSCGWLGERSGYACLPPSCGTIDYYGECDGTTLYYCHRRRGLQFRECAGEGLGCLWIDDETGHDCGECPMCDTGACVDTDSSMAHCGGCNQPCVPPNATGECIDGICQVVTCGEDYVDDDNLPGNGCEKSMKSKKDEGGCAALSAPPLACLAVVLVVGRRRPGRATA
ncbi:trypsin-like serine protease [Myxococcota bacterium]